MSSGQGNKRKKKHPKQYYIQNKRGNFTKALQKGMKGFLFTSNPRSCQKYLHSDCYKILNDFADSLYGPEKGKEHDNFDPDEDFTDQLNKQLEGMKDKDDKVRRFQRVETNVRSYHFVQTQIEDPCLLMHTCYSDIERTGKVLSRTIERMLPVNMTCKSELKDIMETIEPILEQYFGDHVPETHTYYVIFQKKHNDHEETKEISPTIVKLLRGKYSRHTADYKNPELVIFIQILCKLCCISVIKDYERFRRYNLKEVSTAYWKKHVSVKSAADTEDPPIDLREDEKVEEPDSEEEQGEKPMQTDSAPVKDKPETDQGEKPMQTDAPVEDKPETENIVVNLTEEK